MIVAPQGLSRDIGLVNAPEMLVVVGAGRFGMTEVIWVAEEINSAARRGGLPEPWNIVGYADDDPTKQGISRGKYRVHGTIEQTASSFAGESVRFVVAVGDNYARERLAMSAESFGWSPATLIHPSSVIAEQAMVGAGTYIAPGCVVCPCARLGRYVLLNMQSLVAHDCSVEDYVQVSPGVKINGECTIRKYASLGSNATIMPRTEVGPRAVVGPSSCVIQNVAPGDSVLGCPAKVIWRRPTACATHPNHS